jgi:hypothetical protein
MGHSPEFGTIRPVISRKKLIFNFLLRTIFSKCTHDIDIGAKVSALNPL